MRSPTPRSPGPLSQTPIAASRRARARASLRTHFAEAAKRAHAGGKRRVRAHDLRASLARGHLFGAHRVHGPLACGWRSIVGWRDKDMDDKSSSSRADLAATAAVWARKLCGLQCVSVFFYLCVRKLDTRRSKGQQQLQQLAMAKI